MVKDATGPVLILGAGGQLARAWAELLDRTGRPHRDLAEGQFDLADPESIDRAVSEEFSLVVNCAAYTDVDGAEAEEKKARAVNGTGAGHLARRCRELGVMLVHYSTDYVFGGDSREPYRVDAPRNPVNAYGRSKALGEELVIESGCELLLVRASWLYSPWGRNFVKTIAALARERESIKVVDDQTGRPTSAQHLAATTLKLLEAGARGLFHVTDGGQCTWHEFAVRIAGSAAPRCRVESCSTSEFPRPARRPAYSVLELTETEKLIGPMPLWEDNLADVMSRLEN